MNRTSLAGAALLGFAIASVGCSRKPAETTAMDSGTAANAPVDARSSRPRDLTLSVTGEMLDGGRIEFPLAPGTRPEVAQVQELEIQTNLGLKDYRIRLFDEADRAMVSDDTLDDLPDGGIRYRIRLPEPLKTGFRYALVVDAQTSPQIVDVEGREHPDLRLEFRIAGEREKVAPPKKKSRHRR